MSKKNMVMFGLRLEPDAIKRLKKIADKKHLPLRTMLRSWIMERTDDEWEKTQV